MSDERDPPRNGHDDERPSVEPVVHLDAFLDQLVADRRPPPDQLTAQETTERVLAAQLRLTRAGVEIPTPDYLGALERAGAYAGAHDTRQRRPLSIGRGRALRTAATLAGGVALGVAGGAGAAILRPRQTPSLLVEAANARWYDIAAVGDLPPGGIRAFSAGGVLGFLLNEAGRLHAVSALCTHMGCRLKPTPDGLSIRCLCHGARFRADGSVLAGPAVTPLLRIALRVARGRVYALGTAEDV